MTTAEDHSSPVGSPTSEPIGSILLRLGNIDQSELNRGLAVQKQSGEPLGAILRKLGLVADEDWARALSEKTGVPMLEECDLPTATVSGLDVSTRFLNERRLLPISMNSEGLLLAMADPLDAYAIDAMALATGMAIIPRIATERSIDAALERLYGEDRQTIADMIDEEGIDAIRAGDADIERLRDLASEAPVIRLVDHLLTTAVEVRASDIHLEPFEASVRVRYRIDGILREAEAPPAHMAAALVSRVKILAKLNIAERRLAQDGRIRIRLQGRKIDLRVSTLPSLHGESIVIRILEQSNQPPNLSALGLSEDRRAALLEALQRHDGIVLATGPTGSGKTTTLYGLLNYLNNLERKIITVEDPVEYEIPGLTQIHVNADIGLTFAKLLRSIVRHDPDVVMIGEMRDYETAEIAVQSALTGHLVLSTLHTNDAPGAVTRMLDMGVEDYLLVSTLRAVVAQRLVRRLCPACSEPYEPGEQLRERLDLARIAAAGASDFLLYRAKGCDRCQNIGYRGRVGIYELMLPDDALRRLVLDHADAEALKRSALAAGMQTMFNDGLAKALAGITTLEEIGRVAHAS